jgi:hypothetical protein
VRRAVLPALLACFLPEAVAALECVIPNAVADFVEARDADERYRVVYGTFVQDNSEPKEVVERGESGESEAGVLSGLALDRGRFATPFEEQVVVRAFCFSEWCGHLPGTGSYLFFVELHPDGPRVTTGACGGGYMEATAKDLKAVETCHNVGHCPIPTYD